MKIFNEYEAMDSSQERIAYPMERENLCGIAIARTIFHNNHGIVTHEDYLREIAEGPSRRYDVLNEGTDLSSLKFLAINFRLERSVPSFNTSYLLLGPSAISLK